MCICVSASEGEAMTERQISGAIMSVGACMIFQVRGIKPVSHCFRYEDAFSIARITV